MQKFSVVALLGATQAATPSPLPDSTYPKYGTPTAIASGTDLEAGGQIKLTWSGAVKSGLIRGFKNNLVCFPTQTLVQAAQTTAGSVGTVAAAAAGTRTFWQTTVAQIGEYPTPAVAATASTIANGAIWLICLTADLADGKKCNGGAYYQHQNTSSGNISKRVFAQVGVTTLLSIGGGNSQAFTWNEDLLMASFYHSVGTVAATPTTDGTAWCSTWNNKLLKDGTEVTITATNGFTKSSKCTWLIVSEDGTVGPGIQLKSAKWAKFILNWVEWANTAGLGTTGTLPVADGAAYYIGAYAVTAANNDVYLNPMKGGLTGDATWKASALTAYAFEEKLPAARIPGSIGDVIFYPAFQGQFMETQTAMVDQGIVQSFYDEWEKMNAAFNGKVGDFKKLLPTYNDAAAAQEKLNANAFEKAFNPPIAIPARPCRPSLPPKWDLFGLDLVKSGGEATVVTWKATATLQKKVANLSYLTTHVAATLFHSRSGYTIASPDASIAAPLTTESGHIFGRFGQGKMTSYTNADPFYWGVVAEANRPGMLVSFFPGTDADTGLAAAADTIVMNAKAKTWISLDKFSAPGQPSNVDEASKRPGAVAAAANAKMLTASFVAAATVIASLY